MDRGAPADPNDGWGAALAIGDLDQDQAGDLVVGVPGKTLGSPPLQQGAAQVLFGALYADGFETGGTGHWTLHSP